MIRQQPVHGTYGIGHTRWATHGRPTEENAHPHRDCTGRIVVVHNGIVENYLALKQELAKEGHIFATETDTEIIAHLIEQELRSARSSGKNMLLEEAVRRAARRLTGAFAISVISADEPDTIVTARLGPPAVVGVGDGEYFVASDVPPAAASTAPARSSVYGYEFDTSLPDDIKRIMSEDPRRAGAARRRSRPSEKYLKDGVKRIGEGRPPPTPASMRSPSRPDGKSLAMAGADGLVRIVDADSGKTIKEFAAGPR